MRAREKAVEQEMREKREGRKILRTRAFKDRVKTGVLTARGGAAKKNEKWLYKCWDGRGPESWIWLARASGVILPSSCHSQSHPLLSLHLLSLSFSLSLSLALFLVTSLIHSSPFNVTYRDGFANPTAHCTNDY